MNLVVKMVKGNVLVLKALAAHGIMIPGGRETQELLSCTLNQQNVVPEKPVYIIAILTKR